MTDIIKILKEKIDTKDIFENEPMYKHTTFKIGGNADIFIKVYTIEDIKLILKIASENNINVFILGNGSNLIVRDKGIRGIVIKIELKNFEIEKRQEDIIVTVGAGNKLSEVAVKLMNEGITGFEFAAGIPGTIGGLIRMNAGAYGREAKDVIFQTKYMDYSGKIYEISNKEHDFKYRNSFFSNKSLIILETKLKLNYGNKEEIKRKQEEYFTQRKERQPLNFPSAGSVFKRGNNFITAKLIDECGLKGYRIGDAEISDKHAGFIINKGNAKAEDVLKLIEYTKEIIYEKTGNKIETEVEIVGEE